MSIQSQATLVSLSAGMASQSMSDKRAQHTVERYHGSKAGKVKANKQLYPDGVFKPVSRAFSVLRSKHYAMTLPWSDGSKQRLLANKMADEYQKTMEVCQDNCNKEMKILADKLFDGNRISANVESQMKYELGDLFDAGQYPSRDEFEDKFYANTYPSLIENPDDFRLQCSMEERARIERMLREKIEHSIKSANTECWDRLATCIDNIIDAMEPNADGKPKRIFESLKSNTENLLNVLDKFDIISDEKLTKIRDEVKDKIQDVDIEKCRKDETERKKVSDTATDLMEKMKAFKA